MGRGGPGRSLVEDHVHEETGQATGLAAAVVGESRGIRGRTWTHIEALMESGHAPQEDSTTGQNVRRQPLGLPQVTPRHSASGRPKPSYLYSG